MWTQVRNGRCESASPTPQISQDFSVSYSRLFLWHGEDVELPSSVHHGWKFLPWC